jgi:hypothetical protein
MEDVMPLEGGVGRKVQWQIMGYEIKLSLGRACEGLSGGGGTQKMIW